MADAAQPPAEGGRPRLRTVLGRLGLALVAVLVVGFGGGLLYARSLPDRAGATIVGRFVEVEPLRGDARLPAATDDPAPTSGDHVGRIRCGTRDTPVTADDQLASLAAGVVVIQHRADLGAHELARLEAFAAAQPGSVLLAPNPAISGPIVVTGWRRRLPLDRAETNLLTAFVTAYGGDGPRPAPCPAGAPD